ncbi:MAG: hypothetical protein V3R94_03665 [Acidobacteriota bacterium]
MRYSWVGAMSLMLAVGWAAPQDSGDAPSINVDREVSQTAIYLGDVFQYRVSVRHSSEFAFVTEALEGSLIVRPFELLDFQIEQTDLGDEMLMEMVLELVCYEDPGFLEIPSFDLFYYPRDSLSEGTGTEQQDVPARAITIPPHRIHLQSTLLGEGDQLRDAAVLLRFPRSQLILPALSGGVLLILLAGCSIFAVRYIIQLRQVEGTADHVRLQEETLQFIREVQHKNTGQELDPALYLELSQLIRQYLHGAYYFISAALTPEELRDELLEKTSDGDFAASVEELLIACDRSFFDPVAPRPDFSELCEQASGVVNSTPFEL